MTRPSSWTDEQDQILRETVHLSDPYVLPRINQAGPRRTLAALCDRRLKLGIRKVVTGRTHTAEHRSATLAGLYRAMDAATGWPRMYGIQEERDAQYQRMLWKAGARRT